MHPAGRVFLRIFALFAVAGCGDDDGTMPAVDAGTPEACMEFPTAPGCPCLPGATAGCYPAADETRNVGLCRGGSTVCADGRWGACSGAVLPRPEVCDGDDD